jgi:hypothetical protein
MASGPVFMICAPGLISGGTEGAGSCFHFLHARNRFGRYRWRRIPFSCFARPRVIFDGAECVGSRLTILHARIRFRRNRGVGVPFLCFAPGLVFGDTVGVESRFHVLRARTRFRRYRVRQVPFSCFARPDSFSVVTMASGPVLKFCAPGLVVVGTVGVRSRFHVLRARTGFQRYRGRRVPFSCFARPNSFSAVRRASVPVFMFCAPELVFGDNEGVGSRFPDSFSAVSMASGPVSMFCTP